VCEFDLKSKLTVNFSLQVSKEASTPHQEVMEKSESIVKSSANKSDNFVDASTSKAMINKTKKESDSSVGLSTDLAVGTIASVKPVHSKLAEHLPTTKKYSGLEWEKSSRRGKEEGSRVTRGKDTSAERLLPQPPSAAGRDDKLEMNKGSVGSGVTGVVDDVAEERLSVERTESERDERGSGHKRVGILLFISLNLF